MQKSTKYVVIKVAGKQYKVAEGQTFLVDKLVDPKKPDIKVLLMADGDNVRLGKPELKDVKVEFDVLTEVEKGEKIRVFKYKSKSRYRKRSGFRAQLTRLKIKKIS